MFVTIETKLLVTKNTVKKTEIKQKTAKFQEAIVLLFLILV